MIVQKLFAALLVIFVLIDARPIHHKIRQDEHRQRRSPYVLNWQTADILYKRLYVHDDHIVQEDRRNKRSETPLEFRPVKGPISIEQLPAMLAARHVKRYPFSQRDDPAIIGR